MNNQNNDWNVDSKPVTAIKNNAFENKEEIKTVVIPSGMVTIGEYAFSTCIKLKQIIIPNNVTTISDYAFYKCDALESVTFLGNVTTIGAKAFSGTIELDWVIIPATLTSFGKSVLYNASTDAVIRFRGTSAQWGAIQNHNDSTIVYYENNGKIIYNYKH